MAEQGIVELYQRIQKLKNANDVSGSAADKQSEIFRCWGLIQWILKMEGDRSFWSFWMKEDRQLIRQMREELPQVMEELNQTAITPVRISTDTKVNAADLPQFAKYLELPGPVVRENILSFVGSEDLLNVARAIPSEAKYFKPPLTYLQVEAVFPLLMDRNLLDKEDINNLIQINSFFKAFIIRRFETVEWKERGVSSLSPIKELSLDQGEYPICHPVEIELSKKMDSRIALLKTYGNRILHIHFQEADEDELDPEDVLQRIAACLDHMPNLKATCISYMNADVTGLVSFPKLPSLKSLCIRGEHGFEIPFLRKYGEQLDRLHISTNISGGLPDEYPVLSEGSSLRSLHLGQGFSYPRAFLPPVNIFTSFAACHIKVLELDAFEELLYQLLSTVGNHWGNSLESLKLETLNAVKDMPDNFLTSENSTWMLNISFPKLRRLIMWNYPLTKPWEFLLLFPALEELYCYWDYDPPSSIINSIFSRFQAGWGWRREPEPMIKLFENRSQMRRNNIWKLFPQLEKLDLCFDRALTRSECVAFQNQKLESDNGDS